MLIYMIIFVKENRNTRKINKDLIKNVFLIGWEGNRATGAKCLYNENQMKALTTNSW